MLKVKTLWPYIAEMLHALLPLGGEIWGQSLEMPS